VIAEAATVVAAVAPAPEEPPAVETPADAAEVEKNVEASVDRDNPEEMAKFSYPLEYVEGIGPVYAGKLKEIGIVTPLDLLKGGAFPKGRAEIAEKSGISGKLILEWVNHCDLYRIKGVGSEWADLLEEAGVDTVVELSMRNPKNLFDKMNLVNEEKKLVRKTPAQAQVEDWVGQAKQLPRVVNY
jgi:predicted flap endonuclease-1-like 5' DNA nuclease